MSHPITILVNGTERDARPNQTLLELLEDLGIDPGMGGVAIALGLKVIPRSAWATTELSEGDDVEIIRATAGG